MMYNKTGKVAGRVASYEDLWRFTLVNYNAGPGCLSYAIGSTSSMTWSSVSSKLKGVCQDSIVYVENIAKGPPPVPTPTLGPTATVWPTPTAVPTQTPQPTATPED